MIDVMRMPATKDLLLKMTPEERSLLLLLGYSTNQITALLKLITIATNVTPEDPVQQRVTGAQTQIFVRLFMGILWEALLLVDKRFISNKLGKDYGTLLDEATREAFGKLMRRLGTSGSLSKIRNSYAFHHPTQEEMERAFQLAISNDLGEESDWSVFMTRTLFNSFFFVSDFIIAHGMTDALGETDVNLAHHKFLGDLVPMANELSEFAYGFASAVFRKYAGDELTLTIVAKIESAPNLDDLRLPFFVDAPGMPRTLSNDLG